MIKRNVVLVGFMGTGKSSVGKLLAARGGWNFLDMDEEIVARAGKSIARVFAEDGEAAFRAMERSLVLDLSARRGLVISTGGGIVLNPDNIRDFSASGLVVCLTALPEEILRRVSGSRERPLLNCPDPAAAIRELLDRRRQFYDAIPLQLDTTGKSVADVAAEIIQLVRCAS